MRPILLLLFTASILLAADPAFVQSRPSIEPPRRIGIGLTQRRLTLDEAVATAIGANLDVAIERTNVAAADAEVEAARGVFDPTLHWQPSFGTENAPAESELDGANGLLTQHTLGQNFAFHQQTAWNGLTLDFGFNNNRVTSGNPFVSLSPFYTSQMTFTVTQPLLRGRSIDTPRALVMIRRKDRDASAAELEIRALDIASQVQLAYWDLAAARKQVEVDAEAANLARIQLERDLRRIEAGSLPQVESSAAEAELARRLDQLYRSSGQVTTVEDNLKLLVAQDRRDPVWRDEIIPSDSGAEGPGLVVALSEAVEQALHQRPELREIDANLAANDARKAQNADLVKAQVNLVASYSLAGLGGTVRAGEDPFTAAVTTLYQRVNALSTTAGIAALPAPATNTLPGSVIGGFGTSLSSLFGGNYQTVQAGVAIDFTVRNRTARANLSEAGIAQKRLELMRARAEQAIAAQVRNALQAMETARQRVRAADAGAKAAKDKLDSESRLFSAGASTNFLVLTRQNEYSDARRLEVEAEAAFNKAVAQYEAALGTALEARQIEVR